MNSKKQQPQEKNIIQLVRFYIDKIVNDGSISGMKALLLDSVTTKVVSMVYSQSQVLEKEIYLIERLGKVHEPMLHLKAAIFVEPTVNNVDLILKELQSPRFKEYHVFFSGVLAPDLLSKLAKHDENEVILQVQEYYSGYYAINEDFFHLGIEDSVYSNNSTGGEERTPFSRNTNGILSLLLSMKVKPKSIRYTASSDLTRMLAGNITSTIEKESGLFEFRQKDGPLLLLLDRRNDPVTPLLTQWTYQAMVHELLGLFNNRVSLKGAPNITKDLEEVVLSCTQDEFFADHRFYNFGDLGTAVYDMLAEYQKLSKKNEKINSIKDMQDFLERFPDFRAKSINVSKHVAIMGELARLTDTCYLLDVSQLEQDIACQNDHSAHKRELLEKINNPKIKGADKVRLSLLFLIKYEQYNEVNELKLALASVPGISTPQIALLETILHFAGEQKRAPGLFSSGLISSIGKKMASAIKGVENVYTQHQPLLSQILDNIAKNKL